MVIAHEESEILVLRKIKAAGETGKDETGGKYVRQLIVVTTSMFPTDIAGQINRPGNLRTRQSDAKIGFLNVPFVEIGSAFSFTDYLKCSRCRLLQ